MKETISKVNRQFSEREKILANKTKNYLKRCSTSLIITEIQIKTTKRYHLTLVRMAISKNLQTINAGEDVGKGNPLTLLVGMQTESHITENSVEIP